MSQPELRAALLDEQPEAAPPEMTADERFLLGHLAAVAALIESQVPLYRELTARIRREGHSNETRAIAHDAAEKAATVGQSLVGRQELVVSAQPTPFNASAADTVIEQLFYSFTVLAGSEDEYTPAALDPDMLEDLLTLPGLREWMERLGAEVP